MLVLIAFLAGILIGALLRAGYVDALENMQLAREMDPITEQEWRDDE